MKKSKKIIQWVIAGWLFLLALAAAASGSFIGAILFLISGFLFSPLARKAADKYLSGYKIKSAYILIAAVILSFSSCSFLPTNETSATDSDVVATLESSEIDTEMFAEINKETEASDDGSSLAEASDEPSASSTEEEILEEKSVETVETISTESTEPVETETASLEEMNASHGSTEEDKAEESASEELSPEEANVQEPAAEEAPSDAVIVQEPVTENSNADEPAIENPAVDHSVIDEPTPDTSSNTVMVWKSATGSKYHSINNCGNMNPDKATLITLEQAEQLGLGRCSKCW